MNRSQEKKAVFVFRAGAIIGGAERRLTNVFLEMGADVFVCMTDSPNLVKAGIRSRVHKGIPCENLYFFETSKEWCRAITEGRYATVALIDISIRQSLALISAHLSGAKVLWIIANLNLAYRINLTIKDRIMFRLSSLGVCDIDCLYPSAIELLGVRFSKRVVIEATPLPGIDLERYYPQSKDKLIIFASRLVPRKGLDLCMGFALRCASELRAEGYQVRICGDGPLRQTAESLVEENGLSDIIHFEGYCHAEHFLSRAEIFLSFQEVVNYPSQALLEAISSGCYCISINGPDIDKVIQPEYGSLIHYDIEEAKAAVLSAMRRTVVEKESSSISARAFAEIHFQMDNSLNYYARRSRMQ